MQQPGVWRTDNREVTTPLSPWLFDLFIFSPLPPSAVEEFLVAILTFGMLSSRISV